MCEILAAILHIGQLEFEKSQSTTPAADDSGGYSHEGGEDITSVKNKDVLNIIAAFLGVSEKHLEESLGYRTKTLHRERVTVMLDPKGARENADELARTLYSLLVAFIIEKINSRLCAQEDSIGNTVSIVDFPGFCQTSSTGSVLDQLLTNSAAEALHGFALKSFFERKADLLDTEEVVVPATSYFDNTDAVKGLMKPGNGLLSILDDQMRRGKTDFQFLDSIRKRFNGRNPAIEGGSATAILPGSNFPTHNAAAKFTVRHFAGEVDYPIDGLIEANGEVISGDLMNLVANSSNDFVVELFGQEALNKVTHPREISAVVQASVASKPSRMPSTAKRGGRPGRFQTRESEDGSDDGQQNTSRSRNAGLQEGVAAQFVSSINNIIKAISAPGTNPYFVFCLKPNDRRIANQFDSKCVRTQVQTLGIAEISQRLRNADFSVFMPFSEFLSLTEGDTSIIGSDKEKAEMVLDEKSWPGNEARVGATGVFLSERCWRNIANVNEMDPAPARYHDDTPYAEGMLTPDVGTRMNLNDSRVNLLNPTATSPGAFYHDDKNAGYFGSRDLDAKSDAGASAFNQGDMFRNLETRSQLAEKGNETKLAEIEVLPVSGSRKRWLFIVWMWTWMVPDWMIRKFGRMPRKDIRVAWREKLAINMMIWWSCAVVVFLMIGFPRLICPTQHVYSAAELTSHDGDNGASSYIAIRGVVFDLGSFQSVHYPSVVPTTALKKYAGLDATNLFPVQVSALCQGVNETGIDPAVQLSYKSTNVTGTASIVDSNDVHSQYHDFRWATNDSRPDWFAEQMIYLRGNFKKGNIGYTASYIKTQAAKQESVAILNGRIYDFTDYVAGGRVTDYPIGYNTTDVGDVNTNFMDTRVVDLFQQKAGSDVTDAWKRLDMDDALRNRMQVCLDNLFYIADVDTRNSAKCLFATYLLLAISIFLVLVILVKFLAALQFGGKNMPENLDKFIMCCVPAYTEDEDSLRRAIDSAARMKYDDKRKLLMIICDGMIIGQGNDRPTPRIVLDILGVPETVDPEPLSFESLGEGQKQHNMGKVYSGLYEVGGHIVPFLVIVKIGKPSEVSRPGNRGKRDSQMIFMRFLNRVHYNMPMSPLELEMHHHIRNIIGVNPTFYEFLLQIDADTVVAPDAATRFVAAFLHDTRLLAVCGETALSNAKSSIVTMIQVYEYYISHNLIKAFESLFGSVTCLPGCFTMYRIRAADSGKPLFVSKEIIEDYSVVRVDTLHMKNLLHLGEDRYLTTLLLKYHAKYKTKYIFRAHAWTIAPDSWTVFMSQRRRWINSTVHNLTELVPLGELCGFCCFSMRFVVIIDLISTLVQPILVVYLIYLFVRIGEDPSNVPFTSIIMLVAVYGLQALIFIVRRKWEMVGWMLIYILAIPVYSLALPLYSFWHMDDFSWGNTRLVVGEKGKAIVVSDEGKFDPASIPKKKWEDYQAELWEQQTTTMSRAGDWDDSKSAISGVSYATKSHFPGMAGSVYEQGGYASRPISTRLSPGLPPYSHSRVSLAAPSMYGGGLNAPSTYGGGVVGSEIGGAGVEMMDMPSDDAILAEIRNVLATADLMTITKKGVKNELERRFGVGLESRRQYIGSATEAVLGGQL